VATENAIALRPPDSSDTAAAPERLGTSSVFTADEESNSISRVELRSGQVTQLPLPIELHNVQTSPGG